MIDRLPALECALAADAGRTHELRHRRQHRRGPRRQHRLALQVQVRSLGNSVNLASRVQGLTKYLKSRLLVTAATRRQLDSDFVARRVVKTRVVNIQEPVDLYEVDRAGSAVLAEFYAASEAALDALEGGDFAEAARGPGRCCRRTPATAR